MPFHSRFVRIWSFPVLGALCLWLLLASPCLAHWSDLAVGELQQQGASAQMTLTLPTGLVEFADDNHDGHLSAAEVIAHRAQLTALLGKDIQLSGDGSQSTLSIAPSALAALAPSFTSATRVKNSTLDLTYTWEKPVKSLEMRYDLFVPGISTARFMVTVLQGGHLHNFVFTAENNDISLSENGLWNQALSFIVLGIEHIWTGIDHMLFLICLLMLGGGLRYVLKVVTAFTVAHSITLTLAVLNLVSIPPRIVETGIALTIVYVAAENFWRKDLKGRWLITMIFGLVHGLGFASALKELHLAAPTLAVSLVSFNVGVEIGQMAVVSVAFLLLAQVRKQTWEPAFRYVVSGGVIAIALSWAVQRAFFTFT
jgi:hypothetical protein